MHHPSAHSLPASKPKPSGWNRRSNQAGKILFMFVALGATAILGCGGCHKKTDKKTPPSESVPAPTTANATAAPAPRGPVAQPLPARSQGIATSANIEAVTAQLTLELRRYVAYTRTIPKNFEDFTAHDPITFPPPPAGKKYIITGGKVVLQ